MKNQRLIETLAADKLKAEINGLVLELVALELDFHAAKPGSAMHSRFCGDRAIIKDEWALKRLALVTLYQNDPTEARQCLN